MSKDENIHSWRCFQFQNPMLMDYLARVQGIPRKDFDKPFTYCDLGCGNAMSLLTFAAAMPYAEFYGVDIDSQHIENAEALLKASDLTNVHLIEASFKDLAKVKLPKFDYITLHGVASWVSAEAWQDAIKLVKKLLKPDGLVYVSYNALPGSAVLGPLQHLFKASCNFFPGDTEQEKLQQAMNFVNELEESGSAYLNLPRITERMKFLNKGDLSYVKHEYVVENWNAFYFSEIYTAMQAMNLNYIGQTVLVQNDFKFFLPEKYTSLIGRFASVEQREFTLDYLVNRSFRTDVYSAIQIDEALDLDKQVNLLGQMKLTLIPKVNWMGGVVEYPTISEKLPAFASLILNLFKKEDLTVAEILSSTHMKPYKHSDIFPVLSDMISSNILSLTLADKFEVGGCLFDGQVNLSKYNFAVLEFGVKNKLNIHLSSPVLGRAFPLTFVNTKRLCRTVTTKRLCRITLPREIDGFTLLMFP